MPQMPMDPKMMMMQTGPDGKPLTSEQIALQTQQIIYFQQQQIQ